MVYLSYLFYFLLFLYILIKLLFTILISHNMKKTSNKAFTLIELLVVITIIGILATWAVAVYTSQIQKWRDATRITSVNALKWWIEQFYQDFGQYPNKWVLIPGWAAYSFSWVKQFVPNLPKDPKTWQTSTNTSFDYSYNVWSDSNWIESQIYEVSTWLENSWNLKSKGENDWWNDNNRLEVWVVLGWTQYLETGIKWVQASSTWVSTWNPSDANSCVGFSWFTVTACASGNATVLVIR